MKEIAHHRLIILGSGPAGCTAAVYAARANLQPLIITGKLPGGQLTEVAVVDNWPGDVDGVSGAVLMERMLNHAERFKTKIVYEHIKKADLSKRPFLLQSDSDAYTCDALIIATGASARFLGLSSEKDYFGKGVSICATCDGFFYRNQHVIVVGGGNSALTEALYLSNIAKKVTIIYRGERFRGEKILIDKVNEKAHSGNIKIELNQVIEEILGNGKIVTGVRVKNTKINQTNQLIADGVFVAIGHDPNSAVFVGQLEMNNGFIKIQSGIGGNVSATSVAGVFAAGDVTDQVYQQSVVAASLGCMAALDARKYLDQL
jgi:thioredoxin reductase (NADPH)